MVKRKKRNPETDKAQYQLTADEQNVLGKFVAKLLGKARAPRLKVSGDEKAQKVGLDHPDTAIGHALLMEALGTTNTDFLNGLLKQLVNSGSLGQEIDEGGINFMLDVIKGIEPRDQLEAMLAAQMAAVHVATMASARRLAHVENIPQQDSAERAFNKLARTYTTQMEALKRYRTGGEQKVTVQHVSVSEGGQAIVGNVTQAPRGEKTDAAAASPPAITDAKAQPMPVIKKSKEPVSVATPKKTSAK